VIESESPNPASSPLGSDRCFDTSYEPNACFWNADGNGRSRQIPFVICRIAFINEIPPTVLARAGVIE
jgi:hypothetical protein